jgi:glycosyltransferase involved in cell wall biosynthesis
MVVKDEERVLPRCLDSIGHLADEIVVVDTGSSDATRNVAVRYGAKVSGFDFTRIDFSAARNHGLSLATGRWILVLDADEVLDASSIPLIRELAARDDNAGYYLERLNHGVIPKKPTRDHVVRLFPNRRNYRYHGRVHETVDASILGGGGRLVPTAARIDHEFVSTPESRRQRNHWYIGILKEEIAADPSDSSRLDFLAAEYHQLGMFAEAAEITERVTRARPLDPEAHVRAGLYHLLFQPDRQRARADFLEALRLRPGHPRALSFLQLVDGPHGDPKPA